MKFIRSKTYRIFSILAVILVMGIIFFLSAQDGKESSETSGFLVELLSAIFKGNVAQEAIRTFAHFGEYAVLGILMYNVFYSFNVKLALLVSIALSWAYAWSDEIHQYFVPQRAFQFFDLAVDFSGIILGTTVIFLLFRLISRIHCKKGESL